MDDKQVEILAARLVRLGTQLVAAMEAVEGALEIGLSIADRPEVPAEAAEALVNRLEEIRRLLPVAIPTELVDATRAVGGTASPGGRTRPM